MRAHLPKTLARDLQWSSLTLQDATFVDDELRGSESDLLFSVERTAGDQPPAWLYVLLEHQSSAWCKPACSGRSSNPRPASTGRR